MPPLRAPERAERQSLMDPPIDQAIRVILGRPFQLGCILLALLSISSNCTTLTTWSYRLASPRLRPR